MNNILLAIGEPTYVNILRELFKSAGEDFNVLNDVVFHFNYLDELIEINSPNILIVHETYLENDAITTVEREEAWITFITNLRVKYNEDVRIVFLCERPNNDLFLNRLINQGVLDIFNQSRFSGEKFLEQLKKQKNYGNVMKLHSNDTDSVENIPVCELEVTESHIDEIIEVDPENNIDMDVEEKKTGFLDFSGVTAAIKNKKAERSEKLPKEKVIIQEKIVYQEKLKTVTEYVGVNLPSRLILVGGMKSGVGSTLISHILAEKISSMNIPISYIENPFRNSYTFFRYEQTIVNEDGEDIEPSQYRSNFNKNKVKTEWRKENISICCLNECEKPYASTALSTLDFLKVLYTMKNPIRIIDIGCDWNNEVYLELLEEAVVDNIILVADNDPFNASTFMHTKPFPKLFDEGGLKEEVMVVMNRGQKFMIKDEYFVEQYGEILMFPSLDEKELFDLKMNMKWIYSHFENEIDNHVELILKEILPVEFIKASKKKKKGFSLPFGKKKQQTAAVHK